MRGTRLRLRHLVGAATLSCSLLLGVLTFASLPAGAAVSPALCPVLSLGNPSPGDNLGPGDMVISGSAWDPSASSGAGVSSVDLFLGLRDQGGTFLGSAVPGASGSDPRAWSVTVTIPSNFDRGTTFAAYALSSVSGGVTSVSFPISIGTQTRPAGLITPTPTPGPATFTSTCPAGIASAVSAAAAGGATAVPAAPSAPMVSSSPAASTGASTAASACPVLTFSNPSPGDTLPEGARVISGGATAPGGVERVDLFLGARDQGGTFLGSAAPGSAPGGNPNVWSVLVTIPDLGRGTDFAAYAIANNGQQTSITFPVFVGTVPAVTTGAATPTPVPQTLTMTSTCAH